MYRLRLEFDLTDGAFFFDDNYKKRLCEYFKQFVENGCFVFSDVVPMRKKVASGGFWAIKKAALDFCTPQQENIVNLAMNILKTPVQLEYGRLKVKNASFIRTACSAAGYVISPIIAVSEETCIEYENRPELFSEVLRKILLEKYEKIYGRLPEDDRFIFFFRGKPSKEEFSGFCGYRGPFEISGSPDLIRLSYLSGLGLFNEEGYGMISPDLYFWKKKEGKEA